VTEGVWGRTIGTYASELESVVCRALKCLIEEGGSRAEGVGPSAPAESVGETAWTETLVDELAECASSSWVSEDDDMDDYTTR